MPFPSSRSGEARRSSRKIAQDWRWFLCNQAPKSSETDAGEYSMHYFQPNSKNVD